MSDPTRTEHEPTLRYEQELSGFKRVLEVLAAYDVKMTRTERTAAAFLVETFHRENKEEWLQALDVFLGALEERFREGGNVAGVASFAQEFNERYVSYLEEMIKQETDEIRLKNLDILLKRIQADWNIRSGILLADKIVPIGSVISEHVPAWYPYT